MLTAFAGPALSAGTHPASIAVTPNGSFAYVADFTAPGVIYEFAVQPNGALQQLNTIATGGSPNDIVVDPTGRFVYTANFTDGTISEYSIGTNGTLTALPGSPVTAAANTASIIVDKAGKNAYVTNRGANTVQQFSIDQTTGELTAEPAVPTSGGTGPNWLAIDPSGGFAYAVDRLTGYAIAEFAVSPINGSLTPLAPPSVQSSGTTPVSIITAR
jgi:6-phosphogluconolactonase (cycloisomerase 2 family)